MQLSGVSPEWTKFIKDLAVHFVQPDLWSTLSTKATIAVKSAFGVKIFSYSSWLMTFCLTVTITVRQLMYSNFISSYLCYLPYNIMYKKKKKGLVRKKTTWSCFTTVYFEMLCFEMSRFEKLFQQRWNSIENSQRKTFCNLSPTKTLVKFIPQKFKL